MFVRTLVGAAALAVALSSVAFAAQPVVYKTPVHKMVVHKMVVHKLVAASACTTLEHQFATSIGKHRHSTWFKSAEALDARGAKLCATGSPMRGAFDLRAALRQIGVTPAA